MGHRFCTTLSRRPSYTEIYSKQTGRGGYMFMGTERDVSLAGDRAFGVRLFVIHGGAYVATYRETVPLTSSFSGSAREIVEEQVMTGNWRRDGDRLELENLGTLALTDTRRNGKPVARLTLARDLVTSGLKGKTTRVHWQSTTGGPDELRKHFD